ncbi:MAG: DNA recombination protein RmuC [Mangrovibacterium sp.]
MEIVYLFAGLFAGFFIAFLVARWKGRHREQSWIRLRVEAGTLQSRLEERLALAERELEEWKTRFGQSESVRETLIGKLAASGAEFAALQEKLQGRQKETEDLQERFRLAFEQLADRLLKQHSESFTEVNRRNISGILDPLQEKLRQFERQVQETYEKGLKDQTDLKAELKKLQEMNMKISDEAGNLTRALKGDVKKQGNWGEFVLERILEGSGLTEGREYERQYSTRGEDGSRLQPDIVIRLPGEKHLIVDSKVSLVAYERLVNASDEEQRTRFVREHLQSIRRHIKTLSGKHYQLISSLNSPDFVLLFIPIESSFSLAVQADQELFGYAWQSKVVIVSPSTLLATLRTIASIWQQENQTRNALEIARQGGALYDKFVGFISDMEKIGSKLDQTRRHYDAAMNKLQTGQGNLLRSTERLRELGAKAGKKLPDSN